MEGVVVVALVGLGRVRRHDGLFFGSLFLVLHQLVSRRVPTNQELRVE